MDKWVCKICVMTKGLRGSELNQWPDVSDIEGRAQHIESVHHIPVGRDGETEEQTMERFRREYPKAGTAACQCPSCVTGKFVR